MDIARLLSLQGTNKIGNYETYYEFKPTILEHYVRQVKGFAISNLESKTGFSLKPLIFLF